MKRREGELQGDEFLEAVHGFSHGGGEEILTDPDALAESRAKQRLEAGSGHGKRLKALREDKGFTLDELARKTGIEHDSLARVESDEEVLPLGHLAKVSRALSLRISDIISTGSEPFTIVRANQGERFARFGEAKLGSHGYAFDSLAPQKRDRTMEPFLVALVPGARAVPSTHDGQEFIYILEGAVEIRVGERVETLEVGDSAYFDSTTPHLIRAKGEDTARLLAVLHA